MTIMTTEQIDAMRRVRHELGADSVAAHEIGHGAVWVTMWRGAENDPAFTGTISYTGVVMTSTLSAIEAAA